MILGGVMLSSKDIFLKFLILWSAFSKLVYITASVFYPSLSCKKLKNAFFPFPYPLVRASSCTSARDRSDTQGKLKNQTWAMGMFNWMHVEHESGGCAPTQMRGAWPQITERKVIAGAFNQMSAPGEREEDVWWNYSSRVGGPTPGHRVVMTCRARQWHTSVWNIGVNLWTYSADATARRTCPQGSLDYPQASQPGSRQATEGCSKHSVQVG